MTFIYCCNCGHGPHENKCGSDPLGYGCSCYDYRESTVDSIDELIDKMHEADQKNQEFSDIKNAGKTVDQIKWNLAYHKLRALEDRIHKHHGIFKYSKNDPV